MIEVITRLSYESDDVNYDLNFDEERRNIHNRNFDKKGLCDRILNYFEGVPDYNSLKLYCLYGALEEELLGHDAYALRNVLSRDHDIRLFKKCLFHEDDGEVLMVRDIEKLMPYAFNSNLMLLDHARETIDQHMIIPFSLLI